MEEYMTGGYQETGQAVLWLKDAWRFHDYKSLPGYFVITWEMADFVDSVFEFSTLFCFYVNICTGQK